MKKINDLENLAKKYRRDLFEKLLIIKQGHPGSIFSMMEIVVALYHGGFVNYEPKKKIFLDKVLISKGHATATLYPILRDFGVLPKKEWDNWGYKESVPLSLPGRKALGSRRPHHTPEPSHESWQTPQPNPDDPADALPRCD